MFPSARIRAATQLIDQIFASWESEKRFPADKMLQHYFKENRYIGSKDRGAISELVYFVLRNKATLDWWLDKYNQPHSGRMLALSALILRKDYTAKSLEELTNNDDRHGLSPLTPEEKKILCQLAENSLVSPEMPASVRLNYQPWMEQFLQDTFGSKLEQAMLAMNQQAPTDLRTNTIKTNRDQLIKNLNKEGFECKPTLLSPLGIRLSKRAPIFTSRYFQDGHFEVQDEGSQMIALLAAPKAGERVIDFCAGAGGKTLALAAIMENKGRILAWDTSKKRLDQINLRLRRAGVHNVQTHVLESENDSFIKRHKNSADLVLVDAPCSGSGTWRRNPDLKWRFTNKDLDEVVAIQQSILQSAARLLKTGGKLVYATCSVFGLENRKQIDLFLKNHPNFTLAVDNPFLELTPHENDVDGFFAAVLVKT